MSCLRENLTSSSYGEGLETDRGAPSTPRQSFTRQNQGFNDAKNRYGLEHIRHHHERSMLLVWLLSCLGLTLERLYRLRYLHRGSHLVRTAIDLFRLLQLGLSAPVVTDSS
jgi:hypothetical protein